MSEVKNTQSVTQETKENKGETMQGTITKNNKTKGHAAWLKERGYSVTETEEEIQVEVTRFHDIEDGIINMDEDGVVILKKLIDEKGAVSYGTRFIIGGKKVFGGAAAGKMGPASALMMKKPKKSKAPKAVAKAFLEL